MTTQLRLPAWNTEICKLGDELLCYSRLAEFPHLLHGVDLATSYAPFYTKVEMRHEFPQRYESLLRRIGVPDGTLDQAVRQSVLMSVEQSDGIVEVTRETLPTRSAFPPSLPFDANIHSPRMNSATSADIVFTQEINVPLLGMWNDCLNVAFVTDPSAPMHVCGIAHVNREVLNKHALDKLKASLAERIDFKSLWFAFTPYLFPRQFPHTHFDRLRPDWHPSNNSRVLIDADQQGNSTVWYFDQKAACISDLLRLGARIERILDMSVNTFELSKLNSLERGHFSFVHWKHDHSNITRAEYGELVRTGSPVASRICPVITVMLTA